MITDNEKFKEWLNHHYPIPAGMSENSPAYILLTDDRKTAENTAIAAESIIAADTMAIEFAEWVMKEWIGKGWEYYENSEDERVWMKVDYEVYDRASTAEILEIFKERILCKIKQ